MLTYKQFLALPYKERIERYCELSSHDKYLARMNDWAPKSTLVVKQPERSEDIERQKKVMEELEQAIKEGKIGK